MYYPRESSERKNFIWYCESVSALAAAVLDVLAEQRWLFQERDWSKIFSRAVDGNVALQMSQKAQGEHLKKYFKFQAKTNRVIFDFQLFLKEREENFPRVAAVFDLRGINLVMPRNQKGFVFNLKGLICPPEMVGKKDPAQPMVTDFFSAGGRRLSVQQRAVRKRFHGPRQSKKVTVLTPAQLTQIEKNRQVALMRRAQKQCEARIAQRREEILVLAVKIQEARKSQEAASHRRDTKQHNTVEEKIEAKRLMALNLRQLRVLEHHYDDLINSLIRETGRLEVLQHQAPAPMLIPQRSLFQPVERKKVLSPKKKPPTSPARVMR